MARAAQIPDALHPIVEHPAPLARDLPAWQPEAEARVLGSDLAGLRARALDHLGRMGAERAALRSYEAFVIPLLVLDYGAKRAVVFRAGEAWKAASGTR